MGFGWLFLGYVVSFLLSGVGAMLNMKFLVCLLGYVMILRGLWELRKYNAAFRFPLWTVFALMPPYKCIRYGLWFPVSLFPLAAWYRCREFRLPIH